MPSTPTAPRSGPAAPAVRALLRLTPALVAAVAALAWAHHLSVAAAPAPSTAVLAGSAPGASGPAAPTGGAARSVPAHPVRVGYDPRVTARDVATALVAASPRPAGSADVAGAGEAPGPVDQAGVQRAVGGRARLAPLHVDPLPPGVTLASPTDTASLVARSGVAGLDASALTSASTVPPGTPSTTGLTEHVAPSCSGTGTDGRRVQVLYVHDASTPSRYTSVLKVLRNEVANVDDVFAVSSRKTGGDVRVRWVHDAQCLPVVKDVTVPAGSLDSLTTQISAVKAKGWDDPARKYLMFTDANVYCGIGTLYRDDSAASSNDNNGYAASYSRVDNACWSTTQSVAAHELTHNFGGVQRSAPHSTEYGHCWDENDLMCYADGTTHAMEPVCAPSQGALLDCRDDDYFNTHPAAGSYLATHWNVARSSWLDDVASRVPPSVVVTASRPTAETGDAVTLTAVSDSTVTWRWSTTAGCALAAKGASATVTCPAEVTGTVSTTATATDVGSGLSASAVTSSEVTEAPAPSATVLAPPTGGTSTPYQVTASVAGKGPLVYRWTVDGSCWLDDPARAAPTVSCPAGGDVAVGLQVTQADGQQVTAAPAVTAVTEDGPPPRTATAWTAPAQTSRVPLRLRARLTDGAGTATAGLPVRLVVRWRGSSTWSTAVDGLTTGADGYVVAAPAQAGAGWFRFVHDADVRYARSVSTTRYVKVPTRLRTGLQPRRQRVVGRLTTAAGVPVAGAVVRLERRTSSTSWRLVTRQTTGRLGRTAVHVAPRRTTSYRWVFRGEVVHRGTVGPRVLLRRG